MSDSSKSRNTAKKRPSSEFLASQRDKTVREQLEKERVASAAKTAKLRALRLAKEAADVQQALEDERAVRPPVEPPRRKRVFRA